MKNSLYGGLNVVTSAALFSATVTLLLGVSISSGLAAQNDTTWQNAPSEQQVKSLSLREAILRAFARNPEILQSSAQIQVGKGQIDAATAAWFPQISLQGTTGKNHRSGSDYNTPGNPTSAGISLSQLLYDFGKTGGSIDEQKQLTEAYQYQLESVMTDVGTQTIQAYLQSKRYQDLSQSVVKNIASLEKVRDMAKMRADAGLSSQSDVLQAETRIAGMNATYEQYRAQQRTAQAELSVLTGVVAESLPDLPQALTKQKVKPQHISYKDSSMVRSAESKQQAAAQRVRQAEAQHWPTISVQAGRSRYNDNDQSYWDDQVQLVVQAPLYQGGAVDAKVRTSEAERRTAQAEVESVKLNINKRAATANADLFGAQQRKLAGDQQLASATYTRDVYRDEYQLSKRSLNDLLSVEQDVVQADSARINALYDQWDASVRYASAVDNLLMMLGIERKTERDNMLPSL